MKRITFHIVIIIIGFLGIFLGTLPDLIPGCAPIILIGKNRKMEVGYQKLVEFLDIPRGKRANKIALTRDDEGYSAIYDLLRSFDPKIVPPVEKISSSSEDIGFGNISFDKGDEWVGSGTFLLMNQVVFYHTKEKWQAICEMRDLHFLIRDAHIRYYSRLGFFFAFIALMVEGISSLKGILNSRSYRKLSK